jgi:hypothetical protein
MLLKDARALDEEDRLATPWSFPGVLRVSLSGECSAGKWNLQFLGDLFQEFLGFNPRRVFIVRKAGLVALV